MSDSPKAYYKITKAKFLRPLLQNVWFALGVHWIFQGLLYMDNTERIFKIGLDFIIGIPVFWVFSRHVGFPTSILIAILIAHSINLLLNGQIWGVLKNFGKVVHLRDEFIEYTKGVLERCECEQSIKWAGVYGSISRKEWSCQSDLDIRLLREDGFLNGIRACAFLMCERTRALVNKFPLDAYVLDSKEGLKKLNTKEFPFLSVGDRNDE